MKLSPEQRKDYVTFLGGQANGAVFLNVGRIEDEYPACAAAAIIAQLRAEIESKNKVFRSQWDAGMLFSPPRPKAPTEAPKTAKTAASAASARASNAASRAVGGSYYTVGVTACLLGIPPAFLKPEEVSPLNPNG